ncbi:serine hydrolase [Ruminococcus sp. AF37-6AT]|jgi:beta-lactamase class A|nr:serine hydrolase [Ruminococcus sp.]RGI62402.1 serine hydrolase [Ruminococcus sp. TM10-9AT]RHL46898.1 serine hydrolase [Ruminococcus sp. AF37-6AT]RHP55404.1 serine hydrolase [Ruminococcus sp. AF31-16BH]
MNLKKLLLPLLSVSLLAAPVSTGYAAETNVAVAETEQGTLSPSSENSDSVFGGTSASDEPVTDEALQTLLNQIQGQLPADNGSWSVFVSDLINETEGSINDQTMQAASLIKLYIMGAIYENYDQIIGQYGKDSVDSNLHSMITVSDNDAANTLTTYLGGGNSSAGMQAVNSFCQEHGYTQTHMGRMLLASNDQDDNYTSVNDCGHFLIEVYKEEESSYAHASDMYALLKAQTRQNKIPAMLPDGVKTANKTGELDNVENDAGIIYDAANDLVIVFMSQNLSSAGNAQNTIASLSRTIYDYYNN